MIKDKDSVKFSASMLKHLGLISLIICVASVAALVILAGLGSSASISQHVAKQTWSQIVFALLVLISAVGFWTFLFGWFAPHFKLSKVFRVLSAGLLLLLLAVILLPYAGVTADVHDIAAWGMAYAMLPWFGDVILEIWQKVSRLVKGIMTAWLAVAIALLVLHFTVPALSQYFLIMQSSYLAGFWVVMVVISYFGEKGVEKD
jgi:hypothetical protein